MGRIAVALLAPPAASAVISADIEVPAAGPARAFLRVAWYAADGGRQRAVADSDPVEAGRRARVSVALERPAGAAAFRFRICARPAGPRGARAAPRIVVRDVRVAPIDRAAPPRTRLVSPAGEGIALAFE